MTDIKRDVQRLARLVRKVADRHGCTATAVVKQLASRLLCDDYRRGLGATEDAAGPDTDDFWS